MAGSFVDKVLQRIAHSAYVTKSRQKTIDNFQFLTKEEIQAFQLERLKAVLKNAIQNVPFYHRLNLKIDFENFSFDEIRKFPVISKKIIRAQPSDFIAKRHFGIRSQTSGSSGSPFEYVIPYHSRAIELMTVNRAWGMGKDYHYEFGDPVVMLRSYSPKEGEPLVYHMKSHNYYYLSAYHINESSLKQYVQTINESGSKILRGYPSSLYIFALLLKKHGIQLPNVKVLITSSETLLPIYRDTIQQHFGLPVNDWYGQNENTVTVQQCWAGNYHNNDDYGFIELSHDSEIIATSLNNMVQPFIRYQTGDVATLLKEPIGKCSCGRNLSIPFAGILGRTEDILLKDDGTLIPTANFSTAMKVFTDVQQYQIIQEPDRSVEVKLVTNSNDSSYFAAMQTEFAQRLGQLPIAIHRVPEIDRDIKTGKVKVIIQKGKIG